MDSFAWHQAETSARRAAAERFINQNPAVQVMRIPLRTRTSDSRLQSRLEPEESTIITALLKEDFEKLFGNTAVPDDWKYYDDILPQTTQQTMATQSVDTQADSQTLKHDSPSLEQPEHEEHTSSTGPSVAEKDLDEKKDAKSTLVSRSRKAGLLGEVPPCENCQKKHTSCSLAKPRCRRCKEDKEKCIYSQEPGGGAGDSPRNTGRLQPGLACSECGRKGRKCDGVLPECGGCKDRKVECLYKEHPVKQLGKGRHVLSF